MNRRSRLAELSLANRSKMGLLVPRIDRLSRGGAERSDNRARGEIVLAIRREVRDRGTCGTDFRCTQIRL